MDEQVCSRSEHKPPADPMAPTRLVVGVGGLVALVVVGILLSYDWSASSLPELNARILQLESELAVARAAAANPGAGRSCPPVPVAAPPAPTSSEVRKYKVRVAET